MTTQIFKVTLAGILGGILLFAIPFLLFKVFFFFLLIGLLFRLFGGRGRRGWNYYQRFHRDYDRFYPSEGKENVRDQFQQNPQNV
ncbi:hypothetical protein [Dyadobacter sp. NIV53]|uniref:hypothetical protein n=1 Tax=Dyadobacter sp. NIV53 TaxID=2861765 RepID=UPI001C88975C|nr:hypothetical protein [Dyadobacter sp. NIV53]